MAVVPTAAQAAAESRDGSPALACSAAQKWEAVKEWTAPSNVAELPEAVRLAAPQADALPRRAAAEMRFVPARHSAEWTATACGPAGLVSAVAAPDGSAICGARAAKDSAAVCRADRRPVDRLTEALASQAEPGMSGARLAARAIGQQAAAACPVAASQADPANRQRWVAAESAASLAAVPTDSWPAAEESASASHPAAA